MELLKKALARFIFKEPYLSDHPFGRVPKASARTYKDLYNDARQVTFPEIDEAERKFGYAIDKEWMDNLALHTQIVVKTSRLNYQHGRLLYAALRYYLSLKHDVENNSVIILETGTARGFSALCMAKALTDSNTHGHVVSIDFCPTIIPFYGIVLMITMALKPGSSCFNPGLANSTM